jgi:hypothetical protein
MTPLKSCCKERPIRAHEVLWVSKAGGGCESTLDYSDAGYGGEDPPCVCGYRMKTQAPSLTLGFGHKSKS